MVRGGLTALKWIFVLLLISSSISFSKAFPEARKSGSTAPKCGYESCPKTDPSLINVHIVPHTHDDVGWLKTVDQYYYGSKNYIQKAGVQYILDSVVASLLQDPKKKFIYVESAFFFKWWREQTEALQEQVRMLVSEGRLEFIGGAWSMNDEATTHYQSIVDQFTWGLRRLNDTFGECGRPKIGWQIDPFGHSREMASMFAQMSFDGLFLGRIHFQDKAKRLQKKEMEMIWRASENLGDPSEIFTGALFNTYYGPSGSCWDVMCSDEPFVDDKKSVDYNVDKLMNQFRYFLTDQAKYFRTNNIMLTMGGDFHYQDANYYYKNLDKLIKYGNELQKEGVQFNLMYSTPSCYLKALREANQTWPTKSDDFFPYASDPTAVWTGYFTSRPTLKRYERMGNQFLQTCKQLTALAFLKNMAKRIDSVQEGHSALLERVTALREEMGIMQHHDAVTGTEKQHVANDYIRNMYKALQGCNENARLILNELTRPTTDDFHPNAVEGASITGGTFEFDSCHYLNISQCHISDSADGKFMVTVYNPLAHATFQPVRLPVRHPNYRVRDYRQVPVEIQIAPINDRLLEMPSRSSEALFEIVFLAQEIPGLGYKSYYVEPVAEPMLEDGEEKVAKEEALQWMLPLTDSVSIGNRNVRATFNVKTGLLSSVTVAGEVHTVSQEFIYYSGAAGHNYNWETRASGAYIFRPNGSEIFLTDSVELKVVTGDVVDEVYQRVNDWLSQVVRIYHDNSTAVEFEWTVGPIPINDMVGKEVVSRFSSGIESGGVFYTDSNGREMLKRTRNSKALYKEEVVAQNYYPLNGKIYIEDEKQRMAVLTDRAQGATSLLDGSIDVLLHRRLLWDDAFGVGEALNEVQKGYGLIATGKLHMLFSSKKTGTAAAATERFSQNRILMPNWLFFSTLNDTYEDWLNKYKNIASTLTLALPQNVYLMTMEPWRADAYLLRFEHLLEKAEDSDYSKPATFDFLDVFGKLFDIESIRETNLAANQWLSEVQRFKFRAEGEEIVSAVPSTPRLLEEGDDSLKYSITLNPMQIRTFVVQTRQQVAL